MMTPRHFFTALSALALLGAPLSVADTVAGTPDATVHYEQNRVGAAIASLPLLNDVTPSTSARYYIYLCSAGWCAPCNREMPHVVEAYKEMKRSGKVELLLLDYDYTEPEAHAFIEKYGMMFPATMSSHAPLLPGFISPRGIPFAIIVDGEGHVVAKGYASLLREWKEQISAYEKAQGLPLSFPESVTRTLTPRRTLAEVEDEPEQDASAAAAVPSLLAELDCFNAKPNLKAEYYIYLQSASWCGPCRAEMPDIAKQYRAMKRDGRVELVLISGDRTQDDAKSFLKGNKAKFPALMPSDARVSQLPGVRKLPNYYPAAVIVRADGTVLAAGHGSIVKDWRKYTIGTKGRARK